MKIKIKIKEISAKAEAYYMENLPTLEVLLRAHRMWRNRKFVAAVNHQSVVESVIEEGRMTSSYLFMVAMSCAIAILGLLLSSPAVIIGAMLISPLMGPIMSLGFSFCIVDPKQMKKSLEAIVIGLFLSLLISSIIVFVSPLTDPTSEIMARTQPNLFDLLVAIFSGLAGGYATIKQKGATIVGVAIATALMPPLAVVGYGLATGAWLIAQGAFFLFMTNLLAISLSVTILAKWYGFGAHNSSKHTLWQTGLVFSVFALLSVPLGFSLSKIAYQSYITKTAKAEIQSHFAESSSRVTNFSIAFKADNEVSMDCVIITDTYVPEAEKDLRLKLEKDLGKKINLSLDQVVVAKHEQEKIGQEAAPESALSNPMRARLSLLTAQEEMAQAIKNFVLFPLQFVRVDPESRTVSVYPKLAKGVSLDALHNAEMELRSRFSDWSVFVIPPAQALPSIFFETGKSNLSDFEQEKIKDIVWILHRWDIKEVSVVGYASTVGEYRKFNNNSPAYQRAKAVFDLLEKEGVKANLRSEYASFDQRREEMVHGIDGLHRVEVRLIKTPDFPDETEGNSGNLPAGIEGTK